MAISYLNHKGMELMFADYRKCHKTPQQLALLEDVANTMKTKSSNVRLLVDYNGCVGGLLNT